MKTTSILLMGAIIPDALAKNLRVKKSIVQEVSDRKFDCFDTFPMYRNDLITSNKKCKEECEKEDCSGYEFIEGEDCTLFFGKIMPAANRNLRKRARRLMPPSMYHFCKLKLKEDAELRISASHFSCTSGYYIEKIRPNLKRCEKFCNNRQCNEYRYIDNVCTIYGVPEEELMNAESREAEICEKKI